MKVFNVAELACDPAAVSTGAVALPTGLTERPVTEADHRLIHAAIEESFAVGSHAHIARSYHRYRRDVAKGQADTDLRCLAWDGDELAGAVLAAVRPDGAAEITWVVVRRPWRRRGIAYAMLRTVLARCASAGLTRVVITTVMENVNQTFTLYERAGFREVRRLPRYRKPFPNSAAPG